MERGQRLENVIVLHRKKKKICQKEAGCIIFTHQDFCDGESPINPYALDLWFRITTEGTRHLLFDDGPLEEHVEAAEVE